MPTGDEFVNPAMKRFLSQNRISNEMIEYLQENSFDIQARIFPSQGLFTHPVTITPGSGDFALSVTPSGSIEGTDGLGHTLSLVTGRQSSIDYEEAISSTYWIGMKYIEVASGIYDNPRTGIPEYDKWMEEIGELDNPTSVVDDLDGTMTINVNSIFESGVDHSDRSVLVYLVNPLSGDPDIAFETCNVLYSNPNNTIETAAAFGQGAISTNAADYQVACRGVTVRKSVSNPFGDEYTIFGYIAVDGGGTPSATDEAEQIDYSGGGGHTLQKAYDGAAGSGDGKIVGVANEAIRLTQSNATFREDDPAQAVLRLLKNDVVTDPVVPPSNVSETEVGIDAMMRFSNQGSILHRTHIFDFSGNDELRWSEDVSVSAPGDTLTFDRATVLDLDLGSSAASHIWPGVDMVEIADADTESNNGVYIVNVVTGTPTNTISLYELDGITAASLVAEAPATSMIAKIYRPLVRVGGSIATAMRVYALTDFEQDAGTNQPPIDIWVPDDAVTSRAALRVIKEDATQLFLAFNDGDIETAKDVIVGNDVIASGDFSWDSAHTHTINRVGGSGSPLSDGTTVGFLNSMWNSTFSAVSNSAVTAAYRHVLYEFRIPKGATITAWRALVEDDGASAMSGQLYREGGHTWSGTPATAVRTTTGLGSSDSSDVSGNVDAIGQSGLSATVAYDDEVYTLDILDLGSGGIVYAVQLDYSITNVEVAV